MREGVQSLLVSRGYACTVARNGTRAVHLTFKSNFDLMLIARDLPALSGIEATKMIRQREGERNVPPSERLPIVALTSAAAQEDITLYQEVGMDGCISKPIDEISLLNTVAAAVPFHRPPQSKAPASRGSDLKQRIGRSQLALRSQTTSMVASAKAPHLTLPIPSAAKATPRRIPDRRRHCAHVHRSRRAEARYAPLQLCRGQRLLRHV